MYFVWAEIRSANNLLVIFYFQIESGQSDLGTLANVVTSLANLSDSLKENLNNGSTSDSQQEEQSASDITRSEQLRSSYSNTAFCSISFRNWSSESITCVCSAFDTLARVFNPSEEGIEQRLADKTLRCVDGATIQLIGRDQETPIIEVEGPLLTDSHVGFKVSAELIK